MLLLLPKLIYLMKTLYFRKKKLKDKRLIVLLNSCGISVLGEKYPGKEDAG